MKEYNLIGEYQLEDVTICDSLLEMFYEADKKNLTHKGRSGPLAHVNEETKKSTDFWLNEAQKLGPPEKYRWDKYHEEFSKFFEDYMEKCQFNNAGGAFVMRILPQIQWYKPGEGYYKWHIDGAQLSTCDRAVVFMTYLNDVNDGGGTMFYHQDYVVKPKKGKPVFFPAAYTHLQKGEISETEHKYILTGWLWWK